MEQSVLVLILVICLLAAIIAWLVGVWGGARVIRIVALIGLILTGLGVAGVLATIYWWAPAAESDSTGGGRNLMTGLVILVPLVLAWGVELYGILLTLAICLIGLAQTARQRAAWFWVLLSGAVVPIVVSALTGLFLPTIARQGLDISVYFAIQRGTGAIPLVAAVVTTIYTRRTAAQGRSGATLRTTQHEAATDTR